jgi:hypothetical protein
MQIRPSLDKKISKVARDNPSSPYFVYFANCKTGEHRCEKCKTDKTDKRKGEGVIFFICKLPPEDMQIRYKFEIDSTDPSFPMVFEVIG